MFTVANIFAFLAGRRRLVPSGHLGSSRFVQTTLMNSGLIEMVKSFIPPLTYTSHKGDAGRIGVIGGSQDYTGAPYFAAISSLKLGADLSHVFCAKDAASVIKSYSPELIVHPVLDHPNAGSEVDEWLPRLHAVVLGPGLGRNDKIISNAKIFIDKIKKLGIPIIIDADGLYLVTEYPEIIKDYSKAILTPNVVEFSRLYQKMLGRNPSEDEPVNNVKRLSQQLGYVTIVQKGENDIISNGTQVLVCCGEGSPRRCGGQGDLLSGAMGTFTYWAHMAVEKKTYNQSFEIYGPTVCAAYAACLLTRECNRRAFHKHQRSTTTSDMVECIQDSFDFLYM